MSAPPDPPTAARSPVLLAEVTRGPHVESRHHGHVAVVTPDGRLLHGLGDPETPVFLRSAVKPFQVLPLLLSGAADRYGFTDREIAVACASHNGEDVHVEVVTGMLAKIGLPPEAMRFGRRPPLDPETCEALAARGEDPKPQHHECSGEHAGKLALARHLGADPDTYLLPEGPVEQHALRIVARFSGLPVPDLRTAQDNCGVVTYGMPMRAAARMYARLVAPPADWDAPTRAACARIVRAMTTYPELVSGTDPEASLDTVLMRQAPGRLVSKMGAEGVYAAGLPARDGRRPVGILVKVDDGDPKERVRGPVAAALLRRLGLFSEAEAAALGDHREPPVLNDRDQQVGLVRAALSFA